MIDETLRGSRNSYVLAALKVLEVRVNRAHLVGLRICVRSYFNVGDFVRDLFTIKPYRRFPRPPLLPTFSINPP